MPVAIKKVPCCSKRSVKLKKANYAKAKKAADAAAHGGRKPKTRKAHAKKAPNKPAKACTVCGKA